MSRPVPRLARLLPLAAGLLAASAAPAPAQIFFDDFLFDNAGQPGEDFDAFFLWTVTGGSVDLVGGNVPGIGPPSLGGRFVDLDGGIAGLFETRENPQLTLVPGVDYELSFLFNSTGGINAADVAVNAADGTPLFQSAVSAETLDFQQFRDRFRVNAPTLASIAFQDRELGLDQFGIGIDRVILSAVAVPEPTTWGLFGIAALGAAAFRRRRG